ncbi:MAG: YeiH family protein [Candidatus Methanomethylophilaceae archaeon]|nr:YeiH family protein [Candidatus Methanomethylophilaceae archaeon]MDD4454971.1 YeiH family protein [Candidatus Methanomethylophilaceae archaeon]
MCIAIAIPCWFLGSAIPVVGGPVFGILLGMLLGSFMKSREATREGTAFCSKTVLQAAVVFLGFGLNLALIAEVGALSLPIIVVTISVALAVAYAMHRLLRVPKKTSALVGVGSAICGGSAIAAAPVIRAGDEDIARSISVIFLFNVVAALTFPTIGTVLGLSDQGFALFAGTAINDTSSVTAAASSWDDIHGTGTTVLDQATIVKLTRTLAIIPITLILAYIYTKSDPDRSGGKVSLRKMFPIFIAFFVLASIITTICTGMFGVPTYAFSPFKVLSKFLIIIAMTTIGLNTDVVKLIRSGGGPLAMGFACWISIALASLGMQYLLGMW